MEFYTHSSSSGSGGKADALINPLHSRSALKLLEFFSPHFFFVLQTPPQTQQRPAQPPSCGKCSVIASECVLRVPLAGLLSIAGCCHALKKEKGGRKKRKRSNRPEAPVCERSCCTVTNAAEPPDVAALCFFFLLLCPDKRV